VSRHIHLFDRICDDDLMLAFILHRTNSMYHFHDGGSNVTYLTGIFQSLFPELESKVRMITQKALERAEWKGDMSQYGIRSVQYLSFYKAGLKAHRATLKEKKESKEEKAPAFIVYPDQESREEAEKNRIKRKHSKFDPDADEVVKVHLQPAEPPNAIAFTAVIQMSDRAQFAGGDILISKKKHPRTTISLHNAGKESHAHQKEEETEDEVKGYDLDEDTNYDDPEPDEEAETANSDATSHTASKHTQDSSEKDAAEGEFDVFNAETTWISRYTPELGSMLLVHGDYARGMRPVLYGRRNSLIIEYWAFGDGEVGVKRPTLGEAKLLKRNSMQEDL